MTGAQSAGADDDELILYAQTSNDPRSEPMGTNDRSDVNLSIPASARYLRLARLTVAGLAGDLGYPLDVIEDLRIAVDELCAAIIDRAPRDARLELTYREIPGGIQIQGTCRAEANAPPELHAVARELLDMLADDYSIGALDGHRTFQLSKHVDVLSV